MNILPETLKHYRTSKQLTQEGLHEATSRRVSLSTIKRIESYRGPYKASMRVVKAFADVLRVEPWELATAPRRPDDTTLRALGYRRLNTQIDGRTMINLDMVEQIYGVSLRTQIIMAPLAVALLAEASLQWRREKVARIQQATAELRRLGTGAFSFTAVAADSIEEGAAEESRSIAARDIFGSKVGEDVHDVGYDPVIDNPLANYLREQADRLDIDDVEVEPEGVWPTSEGLPYYEIGEKRLDRITGGDFWAWYAVTHGYARIRDIPEELIGDEATEERAAWLAANVPAAERAKQQTQFDSIELNFDGEE